MLVTLGIGVAAAAATAAVFGGNSAEAATERMQHRRTRGDRRGRGSGRAAVAAANDAIRGEGDLQV